jgi:chemotaxis protein methyltransferase CheR
LICREFIGPPKMAKTTITGQRTSAEIRISASAFADVRRLVYDYFGLTLRKGKEQLVEARLGKLMRDLSLTSYEELLHYVTSDRTGDSLLRLADALTTNHTSFLREPFHFEFLRRNVLPEIRSRNRIAFWSAACSTGEEPFSLACVLRDELPEETARSARILATDISQKSIEGAQQAVYGRDRMADVPAPWQRTYFLRAAGEPRGSFQAAAPIRSMVEFRRFNLIERPPAAWRFSVVFCRNVLIYMDRVMQERVVANVSECLEPGGYLFTGHAESITNLRQPLEYVRPSIYRKPLGLLHGARGGHRESRD